MSGPHVLLACLFFGELAGALYEPFGVAARAFSARPPLARTRAAGGAYAAGAVCADVAFFLLCGAIFLLFSALFRFPSFRPYMAAAAAGGFALWRGSLHRTLAFLSKKLYNTYRSGRRLKRRKRRPSGYDEGRKV